MRIDDKEIHSILEIVKFFDDARWSNSILHEKYFNNGKNISEKNKILTHWLRYITNRGVIAEKLWLKTSSLFSEIIYNIENEQNSHKDYRRFFNPKEATSYFIYDESNDYYRFKSDENNDFASRWYTTDYFSIISTLEILKEHNYNLSEFLNKVFNEIIKKDNDLISYKIVFAMYLLTYYNIPQIDKNLIKKNTITLFEIANKRAVIVNNLLSDKTIFNYAFSKFYDIKNETEPENLENFINNNSEAFSTMYQWERYLSKQREDKKNKKDLTQFRQEELNFSYKDLEKSNAFKLLFKPSKKVFYEKRIWCAFRDFLKDENYRKIFISTINEEFKEVLFINNIPKDEIILQLELPGDLWNNRRKFWDCIKLLELNNNDPINAKLRAKIDTLKTNKYYPEQFDITFDFIKRMCESNNCDICPFGSLLHKDKRLGIDFEKLCINMKGKYCPIVSTACNYKFECKGKCKVSEILAN